MRSMARNSTVINACFPLSIQPIEVPRYRAVNEEVPPHAWPALDTRVYSNPSLVQCFTDPFACLPSFKCRQSPPDWKDLHVMHSSPQRSLSAWTLLWTGGIATDLVFTTQVVKLDQDFGSAFSGVLVDAGDRLRALWASYSEQVNSEDRELCAGLPAAVIAPFVRRIAAAEAKLPAPCASVCQVHPRTSFIIYS